MTDDQDTSNTYQIRPKAQQKFQPLAVKKLLQEVLNEQLGGKTYNASEASELCKELTELLTEKVNEIKKFKRYKYVVQLVIGERRGQGIKVGSRCLWDADTDNYTSAVFVNDSIFSVATVFGVYYY